MVDQIALFLKQQWGINHPAEFFSGIAVCTAIPFFLILLFAMLSFRPVPSPFPGWRYAKLGVAGSFLGTLGYAMVGAFLPFFSPDRVPDLLIIAMLVGNVLGFIGLLCLLFSLLLDWRGFLSAPGQMDWAIGRIVVWRMPLTTILLYVLCLNVINFVFTLLK